MSLPTIPELAAAYARGESTPFDTMQQCLAAIDRYNPAVNAIPTLVDRAAVLAKAGQATERIRRGEPVGPLEGLPYCAKDMHLTAGVRTTRGSPIFADDVPAENDPIVQRLLDAGAILTGKSNTPEFAAGSQTFNPVLGRTCNPYDPTKTVGGSSGGAGAALACGMTVVADGSDLAASLRNPAAFCGVAGLRPSSKVDPALRQSANAFSTLSMLGAMANSVADLRIVDRAVHAAEPARKPIAAWAEAFAAEAARRAQRSARDLRLAVSIDCGGAMPVAEPVRRAMQKAIDALRDAGATVVEAFPDFTGADDCFQVLRAEYFVENVGPLYAEHKSRMKDTVVWNVEQGFKLSVEQVAAASRTRSEIFARVAAFMRGFDAWLLPTAQVLPFSLDVPYPLEVNGEKLVTYIDWVKSCYWITVSGHPGLSLPAGFESPAPGEPALPVGLQLMGRFDRDEDLLDVGEIVEQVLAPLNAPRPAFRV